MRIFHKGLILVGIPLLLGLLLISSFFSLTQEAERERIQETKFRRLTSLGARVLGQCSQAFYMITANNFVPSKKLMKQWTQHLAKLHLTWAEFLEYKKNNPGVVDESRMKWLQGYLSSLLHIWDLYAAGQASDVAPEMDIRGNSLEAELSNLIKFADEQTKLAQRRLGELNQRQAILLLLAAVFNLLMACGLAIFFRRAILDRIQVIARNTTLLGSGQTMLPEIGGLDEIAQLDKAFHQMYLEIQNAADNEKNLFNHANDVICVLDNHNKFLRINPASSTNWGYEPSELVEKHLSSLVEPANLLNVYEAIDSGKSAGTAFTLESPLITKDSCERIGLWSVYWSKADAKLFCIVHDITERKRVELMRSRFLKMISSDLKVPLANISSGVQNVLAGGTTVPDVFSNKFQLAQKNVSRLISLVDDLLQVAETQGGMLELQRSDIELQVLLERVTQDLEILAKQKQLQFQIVPCQFSAYVDANKIMQVLVNFLSNAIKFSPEGKIIKIVTEKNEQMLFCRIIDQGRGVPASKQKLVFEKFGQVEGADGKRKAGTGLGLPICKQIIEAHGGKLGVESEEGLGSTFWFSVPADRQALSINKDEKTEFQEDKSSNANAIVNSKKGDGKSRSAIRTIPRSRRLPLSVLGTVLVGVPLLFELVFVGSLSCSLLSLQQERTRELHQRNIAASAGELFELVLAMIKNMMVPQNAANSAHREEISQQGDKVRKKLSLLIKGDKKSELYLALADKCHKKLREIRNNLSIDNDPSPNSIMAAARMLPLMIIMTRNISNIIDRAELIEFASPEKELLLRQQEASILLTGLVANIVVSIALALQFSAGISRRLAILADNTGRAARDEELNPLISGNDELSDLDNAFHEMTARLAEARRKESAVFDNCKDVLCTVHPSGKFTSTNPAAESLWGYSKKELLELSVLELIVQDEREAAQNVLLRNLDQDSVFDFECRMQRKDGKVVHCLWSTSAKKEQGEVFCTVMDISDQKELEQMRQEFLAIVSHDLRTPLTAVLGVTQLAQASVFGELPLATQSSLSEIIANADNLLELINDILDLEKLDAGKMNLQKEKISLNAIFSELGGKLEELPSLSINLSEEIADNRLFVDKDRLCQAIVSLAKFLQVRSTSNSGLQIVAENNPGGICISIIDQGPLIPAGERQTIFDRFKEGSVDQSLVGSSFNAELRLPLAAKIIECHNGTVRFEQVGNSSSNACCIKIPEGEIGS